jgi:hypothetical protein
MEVLTGVSGRYAPACGKYQPPQVYQSWGEVVEKGQSTRGLRLWNPLAVWRPVRRRTETHRRGPDFALGVWIDGRFAK